MTYDYRETGRDALGDYLTKENNILILEKEVYTCACQNIGENASEDELINEYNAILYDVIGDLIDKKKLVDIVSALKEGQIGWDHPMYDTVKEKLSEQDNFAENPVEIVEGMETCRECGSKRVYSFSKQTRSADEGFNTFCTCMGCGSKWSYTG